MENQNIQQAKPVSGMKAVISLLLGIISIISLLVVMLMKLFPRLFLPIIFLEPSLNVRAVFFLLGPIIILVIIGLILTRVIKINFIILGLILGIVGAIAVLPFFFWLGHYPLSLRNIIILVNYLMIHLIIVGPLVAFIGLILGILDLKSTKKKFAIAGIALCLIGLLVPIILFIYE